MTTTSYWLDPAHDPVRGAARTGGVDVAVIGAGVTGCACALSLAERELAVRVYDARTVAGGASGRNGGFALRGGAMPYDEARARLGVDSARALWELTERAIDRLEALAGDAFRRVGSLRLAADAAEHAALEREHAALREDGFAVSWVDDLGSLSGSFSGAILHPPDAAMHPARWVRRLAAAAAEAGAEIVEGTRVSVDELNAEHVVVAVDGWTASLVPELEAVVRPVRGQVLATEPLPDLVYPRPHYARYGYDYWHQLPDRRLIVGGRRDASFDTENTVDDETTTPVIQERIEGLVHELLGWAPRVTHRWAGIWGATADQLPLVGAVPGRDRVWVAGGYSGHGNVLGLACGDLVARAILGENPPELALFDPRRLV